MKNINIHEAKSKLSQLIAAVEDGEESIVLCRNGKPVAQLKAYSEKDESVSKLSVREDLKPYFSAGFDPAEPANDDEWPEDAR